MQILLASPRGFCAGVDRAIDIVNRALEMFGPPIYVKHEVVHNKFVVDDLRRRGARFIEDIAEVPDGSVIIFSAHGVSQAVRDEAEGRELTVFDATCPLVTKVHLEVVRHSREDEEVVLIGHRGHPEVEGTLGQYHSQRGAIYLVESLEDVAELEIEDPAKVALVTQTTLSVEDTAEIVLALKEKYPAIRTPKNEDICYATQNRQDAVKTLTDQCDLVLVVGSPTSSNSNRLKEIATKRDIPSYLIDGPENLKKEWFEGVQTIGLTAGASAPELLVTRVLERLREWGVTQVTEPKGVAENMTFTLPKELRLVNKTHSVE
ncbi:MAG TPA: 4-hydroxy-3-methylbut-2-enyl diphosphate reductase [Gammaproteobacteria bacterium]|nr:4-hydroxy-3-methylbut-2-enyl diphosphate reductase [Gammaproteobacteria bacterium]